MLSSVLSRATKGARLLARYSTMSSPSVVVVTGSTGTGKSQLAIEIARKHGGEVLNADALQLYKGLPIATNKVSPQEMQGVRHHLLGCIALQEEPWTVGRFVSEAQRVIGDIHSRGKLAVVTGGTNYYIQSLLLENNIVAAAEEGFMSEHEQGRRWPILDSPAEVMMEKLRELDPETADLWHPRDTRKIRRSLAICLGSGRKVSDIYREQRMNVAAEEPATKERYPSLWIHLQADRRALVNRLDARVDRMIEHGLLAEVQFMHEEYSRLRRLGHDIDETTGIWVAIGYKEFAHYVAALSSGVRALGIEVKKTEGYERTKISTRQYAKRQEIWVKNKLAPALGAAGCGPRFFVFDVSDITKWNEEVETPVINITQNFLTQKPLPEPSSVGNTAEFLSTSNKATKIKHICEICEVTTTTVAEWEAHILSKKHKAMIRHREKSSSRDYRFTKESSDT